MSLLTPGRNLVLIGLMGSGKTTVGRLIAGRLGRPFVDTDDLVERDAHRSVAQIFADDGERGFRQLESAAVRRVAALRGQVVAVGGGAVLDPGNVTQLRSTGDLVLLDADPATLADRVGDTATRPLLSDAEDSTEELARLRDRRAAAYANAAGHAIDTTGRTPEEIADAVLDWARGQHGLLSRDEVEA
jgi:shikimate kinase